jgi:hypothetical protein
MRPLTHDRTLVLCRLHFPNRLSNILGKMTRQSFPFTSTFVALTFALLLSGCAENPVVFYEAPKDPVAGNPSGPLASMQPAAGTPRSAPRLTWTKPESWQEKPGSEMRLASYAARGEAGEEADISVFSFPDAAGGLLANINRWRAQVGLDAVADDALESTATATEIAGLPGWLVDFAGNATGGAPMMGSAPAPTGPTRIVGAIVAVEGTSWFFKMMGPDAFVAAQREAFGSLVASIRRDAPAAPARDPHAGIPGAPPMAGTDPHAGIAGAPPLAGADPHAGVPGAPPLAGASAGTDPMRMDPTGITPPPARAGFTFDVPAGWQQQPGSQFRLASFLVPGPAGTTPADMSVSAFPGMSGQDLANVNRWRGQVGLPPFGQSELEATRIVVPSGPHQMQMWDLESPGPMLQGGRKVRMLVAMLDHGDTIWFYKLTGESELVAGQRSAFVQFLESFRLDGDHAH